MCWIGDGGAWALRDMRRAAATTVPGRMLPKYSKQFGSAGVGSRRAAYRRMEGKL